CWAAYLACWSRWLSNFPLRLPRPRGSFWCFSQGTFPRQAPSLGNPRRARFLSLEAPGAMRDLILRKQIMRPLALSRAGRVRPEFLESEPFLETNGASQPGLRILSAPRKRHLLGEATGTPRVLAMCWGRRTRPRSHVLPGVPGRHWRTAGVERTKL